MIANVGGRGHAVEGPKFMAITPTPLDTPREVIFPIFDENGNVVEKKVTYTEGDYNNFELMMQEYDKHFSGEKMPYDIHFGGKIVISGTNNEVKFPPFSKLSYRKVRKATFFIVVRYFPSYRQYFYLTGSHDERMRFIKYYEPNRI